MRTKDIYEVLIPAKLGGEDSNVIIHVCPDHHLAKEYFVEDRAGADSCIRSQLSYVKNGMVHKYISMFELTKCQGMRIKDFIIEV